MRLPTSPGLNPKACVQASCSSAGTRDLRGNDCRRLCGKSQRNHINVLRQYEQKTSRGEHLPYAEGFHSCCQLASRGSFLTVGLPAISHAQRRDGQPCSINSCLVHHVMRRVGRNSTTAGRSWATSANSRLPVILSVAHLMTYLFMAWHGDREYLFQQ